MPTQQVTRSETRAGRRWWVLAILGLAQMMVTLDATIVNIALPAAQRSLAFSDGDRQWVVTAYALAFGSLLLIGGRAAGLLGYKRALGIGLLGFAAASAAGGAATSFAMLVAARAVQGASGALLAPATLAILTTTFTGEDRGKAFGIFGGIAGAGASIGLLLGGVLTAYASWRWTLYVNLVLAAAALAGTVRLLPPGGRASKQQSLDIPGTVAATTGLFAMVYAFSNAQRQSWTAPGTQIAFAAAAVLLAAFLVIETSARHPVLPVRIILDRNRGGSLLAIFFCSICLFALFLFLTYYMQATLGYSAITAGIAFLPNTAMVALISVTSGALLRRASARLVVPLGMTLAAAGMLTLARITVGGNYTSTLLPGLLIFGLGLGFVFATGFNLAVAGVPPADASVVSATVNTMQQIGGSVGIALFSTLAADADARYSQSHRSLRPDLLRATATVHSYIAVFTISALIFLAGALICAAVLRGKPASQTPD